MRVDLNGEPRREFDARGEEVQLVSGNTTQIMWESDRRTPVRKEKHKEAM